MKRTVCIVATRPPPPPLPGHKPRVVASSLSTDSPNTPVRSTIKGLRIISTGRALSSIIDFPSSPSWDEELISRCIIAIRRPRKKWLPNIDIWRGISNWIEYNPFPEADS
jgi:hypothetical protein